MVQLTDAAERKAVIHGGYPDFVHLRDEYNEEEPDDGDDEIAGWKTVHRSKEARLERTKKARTKLEEDFVQLRLQYNVLLHLVREHFRPDAIAARSIQSPVLLTEHRVQHCTSEEMRRLLEESHGWRGLKEPVVFQAPSFQQPFTSRERILGKGFPRDFPTATVLGDALAAQFGPDWLAEGQTFEQCTHEHCFSQVQAESLQGGPLRELYEALPSWMRCPMVVMSTGPGGSGVAFHKHSSAWLIVLEGVKHWWLYPPGGPPTEEAYRALALCTAAEIADAVAKLPPKDRPIEITQRAGEGLFVPALWWHATFNVGPTLGIGSQYHVFDLNFTRAVQEYGDSAFVLYHYGCEIHKAEPLTAAAYFEDAILREPLNFYYGMNQLRFYLNLVRPPKLTLYIINRLLRTIHENLDTKRQMLVLRFVIPSLFDYVEWNKDHDRLLKYSCQGCKAGFEAVLKLTQVFLPGGSECRLTSSLPNVEQLRYSSKCAQCGGQNLFGRAGDPNSIWAHKFYCLQCLDIKAKAKCSSCGEVNQRGQMGHAGTDYAQQWYCAVCWKSWQAEFRKNGMASVHIARTAPAEEHQAKSKLHETPVKQFVLVD